MQGWAKYPFRVKSNGKYYAPGEAIQVDDVQEAVEQGAEAVEQPPAEQKKRKRQ